MFFFSENVAKNDDLARALTEYPRKIQNSGVIKTRVKRGVLEDENISFLNFSDGPRRPEYYVTSRLFTFGKKNFVPSFFSLLSFFWHLGRPNRAEDLCMENEKRSCDPRNPVIYRPLSIPFFLFISVFGKLRLNLFQNLVCLLLLLHTHHQLTSLPSSNSE